jgi:IS5 family transposase
MRDRLLGRPKNDPELAAAEKQQFIDDRRQRNAVEAKIEQVKRRFGLGLIREKLAATQGSTIAMNVVVMNLEKLLDLLFVLVAYWLQLLLSNQPPKGSRFVCMSTQIILA